MLLNWPLNNHYKLWFIDIFAAKLFYQEENHICLGTLCIYACFIIPKEMAEYYLGQKNVCIGCMMSYTVLFMTGCHVFMQKEINIKDTIKKYKWFPFFLLLMTSSYEFTLPLNKLLSSSLIYWNKDKSFLWSWNIIMPTISYWIYKVRYKAN